ncbi:hypothetical protein ACS386_12670 [Flavobacteriaceae bacterium LMO-SS05]
MKKLVLLIFGFILGALAMYFYCCVDAQKPDKGGAITKPSGLITPIQAEALNANWTKSRKKAVDSAAGRPDNRSSWWSLVDLQNYLTYAEHQADSLGYTMDGVRVYLGVYTRNAPNGKADYTTMFMIPTGRKAHSESNVSVFNLSTLAARSDISGSDGLNDGAIGNPPDANYLQH